LNSKEKQKPLITLCGLLSSSDRSYAESPAIAGGG
jgi:hypothetical protein